MGKHRPAPIRTDLSAAAVDAAAGPPAEGEARPPTVRSRVLQMRQLATTPHAKRYSTVDDAAESIDGDGAASDAPQQLPGTRRSALSGQSQRVRAWGAVLTAISVYNAFAVPFAMGFRHGGQPLGLKVLDAICDACLWADIALRFNLGFMRHGVEVRAPAAVRRHYLSTFFAFDLSTALPLDLVAWAATGEYNAAYRIGRVLRLLRAPLQGTNAARPAEPLSLALSLAVSIVLIAHWFACLYFKLSAAQGFGSTPFVLATEDEPILTVYLLALHFSLGSLTGITTKAPATTLGEKYLMLAFALVGITVMATLTGSAYHALQSVSHDTVFRQKMETINAVMASRFVPHDLAARVRARYRFLWSRRHTLDETAVFADLPDHIRGQLYLDLYRDVLEGTRLFCGLPEPLLRSLLLRMEHHFFGPGDAVVVRGEVGDRVFFVLQGILTVVGENDVVFGRLCENDVFGEVALLFSGQRTATVEASTFCDLLSLSKASFDEVLQDWPEERDDIVGRARDALHELEGAPSTVAGTTPSAAGTLEDTLSTTALQRQTGALTPSRTPSHVALAVRMAAFAPSPTSSSLGRSAAPPLSRSRGLWQSLLAIIPSRAAADRSGAPTLLDRLMMFLFGARVVPAHPLLDALVVVVIIYNAFLSVFYAVFADLEIKVAYLVLNAVGDMVLWLFMAVSMRTCRYEADGRYMDDPDLLAARYRRRHFVVDALGALPLDLVFGYAFGVAETLRLIRLIWLVRLPRLLATLRGESRHANLFQVVVLVFIAVLVAHWLACTQAMLSAEDIISEAAQTHRNNDRVSVRYLAALVSVSSGMTGIGVVEAPTRANDALWSLLLMLAGVFVQAVLLASAASIVTNLEATADTFRSKFNQVRRILRYRRVPAGTRRAIEGHFQYLWGRQRVLDERGVFEELPLPLQADIMLSLAAPLLRSVELFDGCGDSFLRALAVRLRPVLYAPGAVIVERGEPGKEMFLLVRGQVAVFGDSAMPLAVLQQGAHFGEIALLVTGRRTATVRAIDHCDVYVLGKADLDAVLSEVPAGAEIVQRFVAAAQRRLRADSASQSADPPPHAGAGAEPPPAIVVSQNSESLPGTIASVRDAPEVDELIDQVFGGSGEGK